MQEGVIAYAGNVCHLKATVIIEQNDLDRSEIDILNDWTTHKNGIVSTYFRFSIIQKYWFEA